MKHIYFVSLITALVFCCGCTKQAEDIVGDDFFRAPDITPVRKVLKAAMPLAYAANMTMAAINGASLPNVTVARTAADTSTGCFLAYITMDNSFPLPGNVRATGRIITAGISVDNRVAIMTAVFSEMNVSQGSFTIQDISTFPVVSDSDIISGQKQFLVVYSDIDVNSGSDTLLSTGISQGQITAELTKLQTMESFDSGVAIEENAWIVRVNDNNTLSNALDDTYAISGGGQYIEVSNSQSEIVQITMINASMSPLCTYNPTEGYAFWQNLGVASGSGSPEIGHVFLSFHNTCDGDAEITIATGVYATSFGKDIALKLGE